MPHSHIISSEEFLKNYKTEIQIHSTLKHSSIVAFYDVYHIENDLPPLLIMEKMWMSLYSFIERKLLCDFPLLLKLHILIDVAKGLSYLHERKIIHRDITLSNILLTTEFYAKISDFGNAQQLGTTECNSERCSVPGNALYMPPESLNSTTVCGPKLDVFSFGCNILCIINETIPSCEDQFSKHDVAEKYLNSMPSEHCLLKRLAASCLADMPEHRPDIGCVIANLNTIASICIIAKSKRQTQIHYAPGVKKGDINNAQVASRKRLKTLKEHGNSKAAMRYEILATNDAILNGLKYKTPESGQHTDWLCNLVRNFNQALIEAYMHQTYLEKYFFSSKPYFFEFFFTQSNISALSINTVVNPLTAAITVPHVTHFVALSQSKTEALFTRKQVINVSTLTNEKTSAIPNVKLVCSCSYMTSVAKESLSFSKAKISQCLNEIYSSCVNIAVAVFSFSDSSSVSSMKTELAVRHVRNIASANLSCSDAKLFEYFGFTIVLIAQKLGALHLFHYQCSVHTCYHNNARLNVVYQTIVKRSGKLLCITSFYSAYFSADGVQKKFWYAQHTECTVYDQILNTGSMYTVSFAKMVTLIDIRKMLHVNAQHKPTCSNDCWMSKLEFTKSKQPSINSRSLCTEAVLCLQRGALFSQSLSKILSDVKSNLTSCHDISITDHFSCNQEQIESINFYAKVMQYNLQGSCIDSYSVIDQCSVSMVSNESSTSVHTLPLCQQSHTAILPHINCKHLVESSTNVITKHYNKHKYLDNKMRQTIEIYSINSISTQLYHYYYSYGMYYKEFYRYFYVCFTAQKNQVTLSIHCSLHLCICYNTQLVLTLQCTCKYICHRLCNAASCNGQAKGNDSWNIVLLYSYTAYYFLRERNTISSTSAQKSISMLGMQDNLFNEATTVCLNRMSLVSFVNSCKNANLLFKWHSTSPAKTVQDINTEAKEVMQLYGNSTNFSISVAFDGKESIIQENVFKMKVTEIYVNAIPVPARNNKDAEFNAAKSSTKKVLRKCDVMKCTNKLDEWVFLHTDKGF